MTNLLTMTATQQLVPTVVTTAPYRLSLAGGGTDLPWYAEEYGARCVVISLTYAITVTARRRVMPGPDPEANTLESLAQQSVCPHLRHEVRSIGDLPSGSGMGSSGAYLVAVVEALTVSCGEPIAPTNVAHMARDIEERYTSLPSGYQDQFASAIGGANTIEVSRGGEVTTTPISCSSETLENLSERLVLVHTGISRASRHVLKAQRDQFLADDGRIASSLHDIKGLADEMLALLESGETDGIGELFSHHWRLKKERSAATDSKIDTVYDYGLKCGAIGGKLLGAGSGGFMLFDCPGEAKTKVTEAFRNTGSTTLPVKFGTTGVHSVILPSGCLSPR